VLILFIINAVIGILTVLVDLLFIENEDIASLTLGVACICTINCFGLAVMLWPPISI